MKRIIIYLLLFASISSAAQNLQWKADAEKIDANSFRISVQLTLANGWHVYTEADTLLGIEALHLQWDNETIKSGTSLFITMTRSFTDPLFDNKALVTASGVIQFTQQIYSDQPLPASFTIQLKGFISNNAEFIPIDETKTIQLAGGVATVSNEIKLTTVNLKAPAAPCGDVVIEEKSSLLSIFIKGFGGGLLALLMPCLFPMIPVTVSFFTNRSENRKQAIRKGMIYGVSILSIYLLASAPFHLLKGVDSQIFNSIATNAWVNIIFFIIFVIFALSLFGIFELKLPSSFANKAGATPGIFFMALTLVIVSFSCTGPILGALLVGSLTGPWELTAGMGGFGLALALPFTLFAIFPQWLRTLPKSGGWLTRLKVSLAFIELGLAIKFLSNADLVEHWGILKREFFIGCWILVATGLSIYLLRKFSWGRIFFGLLSLSFALYLIPGLSKNGGSLNLLSGFAPPMSYSIYTIHRGVEPDFINDYAGAVQLSKQTNKPILIDFTGWACVNCRKMEEQVWTQPEVTEAIKRNYILVSLYVDDRKKLPATEQFTYEGKFIKTVGEKWALFQAVNFGAAS